MSELYFLVTPEEAAQASRSGHALAHMAYGCGTESLQLTVGKLSLTTKGGWMVLTDQHMPPTGDIRRFAAQVRQEVRNRRYEAILFDFEQPANDRAYDIISASTAGGIPFLVPDIYAEAFPTAQILVDSAISGGDLKEYLQAQTDRWSGRICLALHPLRMRFPMPSESPEGESLSVSELEQILLSRPSYFSRELGCRYFTQQIDGQFFFTLYDDASSLRYKLELADQLDIRTAVALYQEVKAMLPL